MRNISLAMTALACLTCTVAARAADPFTVDPGDPSVLYPNFTGVDDTYNIQQTVNYALTRSGVWQGTRQNSCTIRLTWKGRPWVLTDTVQINGSGAGMPNFDQVDIALVGDAKASLIEYRRSPLGPFRGSRAAFRTWGVKRCRFENIGIRIAGDAMSQAQAAKNMVGFMVDSRPNAFSSSWNSFVKCRVEFAGNTTTGTGFLIGAEAPGAAGADFSVNKFDHCEVSNSAVQGAGMTARQKTTLAVSSGHTGFALVGTNNLAETFTDCSVNGLAVGFKAFGHSTTVDGRDVTFPAGGSGSMFRSCGGSYVGLGYWFDGGFKMHIDGGRWEHVGSFLLVGTPFQNQGTGGSLVLRNVTCQNSHHLRVDNGLTYRGELLGFHSPSRIIVEGCQFSDYGRDGRHDDESGDPVTFATQGGYAPLVLDMNVGQGQPNDSRRWPIVHWDGNVVSNIGGQEPFDPYTSDVGSVFTSVRGQWRLVSDGMTKVVAP
ncbi:MAG: hypothetical protein JST30_15300 [Armatimonadetes bacterium]|nr:hypothetical protein [Armatimonadota bacterium]